MRERFNTSMLFDEVELAPGETRTVEGRCEECVELFRGTMLIVRESEPATAVLNLVLMTRARGPSEQMPPGPKPSRIFSAAHSRLSGGIKPDTHDPALGPGRITVRNGSENPVRWSAELQGQAVYKKDA